MKIKKTTAWTKPTKTKVSYPFDNLKEEDHMPEEAFMDPDEEMENTWSAEEIPFKHREILKRVPKRIRQHIRRTRRGLGHPSRETMVKMIELE